MTHNERDLLELALTLYGDNAAESTDGQNLKLQEGIENAAQRVVKEREHAKDKRAKFECALSFARKNQGELRS